jgi:hypothetical protein
MNVYPTAFYVKPTTQSILAKGRLKLLSKSTFLPLYRTFQWKSAVLEKQNHACKPKLGFAFPAPNVGFTVLLYFGMRACPHSGSTEYSVTTFSDASP